MTKKIIVFSLEELPRASEELLKACTNKKIFAFLGEMGAGKTTVINSICKALGVKEKVTSPTFAIVNEYRENEKIFHLDLFRLKDISEALSIGIEEYFSGKNYCFIEWPQLVEKLLPDETVHVIIEIMNTNERRITLQIP